MSWDFSFLISGCQLQPEICKTKTLKKDRNNKYIICNWYWYIWIDFCLFYDVSEKIKMINRVLYPYKVSLKSLFRNNLLFFSISVIQTSKINCLNICSWNLRKWVIEFSTYFWNLIHSKLTQLTLSHEMTSVIHPDWN